MTSAFSTLEHSETRADLSPWRNSRNLVASISVCSHVMLRGSNCCSLIAKMMRALRV